MSGSGKVLEKFKLILMNLEKNGTDNLDAKLTLLHRGRLPNEYSLIPENVRFKYLVKNSDAY